MKPIWTISCSTMIQSESSVEEEEDVWCDEDEGCIDDMKQQ